MCTTWTDQHLFILQVKEDKTYNEHTSDKVDTCPHLQSHIHQFITLCEIRFQHPTAHARIDNFGETVILTIKPGFEISKEKTLTIRPELAPLYARKKLN